jgi:hypothetical protein
MVTKPGKPNSAESVACAIKLPCCRCLDGSATEIKIDTGLAPWRVTTPQSQYQQIAVPVASIPGSWTTLLAPAVWIGPPGQPEDVGDYEYELQFYIPNCMIPSDIHVIGQAAADNRANVFLDGGPLLAVVPGFTSPTPFTAGPVTGTGIHKLRFVVTNDGGPTGLVVRAAIIVRCPEQLEHDPLGGTATTDGHSQD